MAIISCPSCGAGIDDTSRFCRSCGRPFDPSELTTRQLEPGVQYQSPTQAVNPSPTTPAYVSPIQMPAAPATNDLAPASKNRTVIVLLAATVGLLLFLLFAVFLVKFNNQGTPTTPAGRGAPASPGIPPPPSGPTLSGEPITIESLKYPGAKELMNVKSAQGKGMLQLQTKDSTGKVVEWYTAKIKPTDNVTLPFGNALLHSGDIAVVISGNEDGTSILITRGGDDTTPLPPPR